MRFNDNKVNYSTDYRFGGMSCSQSYLLSEPVIFTLNTLHSHINIKFSGANNHEKLVVKITQIAVAF